METKATTPTLGLVESLTVPIVQEIAKQQLKTVPPRYVRLDQQQQLDNNNHHVSQSPEIPVIDMQALISEDTTSSELQKLHTACKEWGFFQLVNHGVSGDVVEKVKVEIDHFFKMGIEEKSKYRQKQGDMEGYGNAFVVSEEQKLDWGDMFYVTTLPLHKRRPHLIPNLPLTFREALEAYSSNIANLSTTLFKQMAKALAIEENELSQYINGAWQGMRMNYYPPCPQPELAVGLCPHSDGSGITILLQVNEVEGLQIKKDATWIPIKPLPNAFIVNVGDALEVTSNGIYKSIEHRATVNSEKERVSIATFCSPIMDGEIGPSSGLVTPLSPALFRRMRTEEYYRGRFTRKLDGKSYLDTLKIEK